MSLLPTIAAQDSEASAPGSTQDSLIRLLLGIDLIQVAFSNHVRLGIQSSVLYMNLWPLFHSISAFVSKHMVYSFWGCVGLRGVFSNDKIIAFIAALVDGDFA